MKKQRKNIVILGSTGSIGSNAVKIAEHLPDELNVYGIVAKNNIAELAKQATQLKCKYVITSETNHYDKLKKLTPIDCKVSSGNNAINDLVTDPNVDMVLCAIVGTGGVIPILKAIQAGKDIAIASKEILVMAGSIIMEEVNKSKGLFIPVDSEHSAIFQCLDGKQPEDLSKVILTASGGPFRERTLSEMENVNFKEALAHPVWDMGPKVSIDSATLMNKALEIIEAHWLFNLPGDKVDVVIHPQSIIHSMVELTDGTMLAQMSSPDMRFPIQYALTYPLKHKGSLPSLDFKEFSKLTFEIPDRQKFPSLDFAYNAIKISGTMPAVMNAANEIAVEHFSKNKIKFTDIWKIVEKTMEAHNAILKPTIEDLFDADNWAKSFAESIII